MKTFRCDVCGHPLFFENVQCLRCGSALAFLPDRLTLCAIEPVQGGEPGRWRVRSRRHGDACANYRLCINHMQHQACNFAVREDDPNPLCVSCRLTRVLPDLSVPGNRERWYHIEVAKRRLFYTLATLSLLDPNPPHGQRDGPIFEFLADWPDRQVFTGHAQGVITLNIAEADDEERVRRRVAMHEPYRTLLGHLRHESGHYYWERLIADGGPLERFRAVFGDEQQSYPQALDAHYARADAAADWQDSHVSAYAASHPWEDWAETWAHYLHMVDLLETASSYGTKLAIPGDESMEEVTNPFEAPADFTALVDQWIPLTLLLNSLNRSLGQEDAYPFALRRQALGKLRFVHEVIHAARTPRRAPAASPAVAS
jgi:hypothetical protein